MEIWLEELLKPFPSEEHSHKSIGNRSEDWVEDHYLIKRLNAIAGPCNWKWECKSEGFLPEQNRGGKPVYVYHCRYALSIYEPKTGQYIEKEGVGGDTSPDLANAMKGAASYAMRHACKKWGIALECWVAPTEEGQLTAEEQESFYKEMLKDLHQAFIVGVPHATVATSALKLLSKVHDNSFTDDNDSVETVAALKQIAEKHNPKDSLSIVKEKFMADSPRWKQESVDKFRIHMREVGRLLPK